MRLEISPSWLGPCPGQTYEVEQVISIDTEQGKFLRLKFKGHVDPVPADFCHKVS